MANRTVLVRLRAEVNDFNRGLRSARMAVRELHDEIDKTNDRTAWLAQGVLALAPAVTTLGASAVPVVAGLATQMTVAGIAAGTMGLAFNGVFDGLDALNKYQLEPSAENLEKLNAAMQDIGPHGEEFVRFLDGMGPAFTALSNTARGNMFPGLTEGLDEFMSLMPRFHDVVAAVSDGIGTLATDAGTALASERWSGFFDYLETEARPVLVEMGRTMGNFIDGIAAMIVAFAPVSSSFSRGFEDMSRSFADWAHGLETSSGFQSFLDYIAEAGPKALDFLGSLSLTIAELIKAAAPVGAVMLPGLTAMVDVLGALAATPLGPIAIGFTALTSAWGRLNALAAITGSGVMAKATDRMRTNYQTARMLTPTIGELGTAFWRTGQAVEHQSKQTRIAMTQVGAFTRAAAPMVGQMGLLAVAASDFDNKLGLANTTTLTLAGSMLGPMGAAGGALVGLFLDMRASVDEATGSIQTLDETVKTGDMSALKQQLEDAQKELDEFLLNDTAAAADWLAGVFGGTSQADEFRAEIEDAEQALADLRGEKDRAADGQNLYRAEIEAETAALEENVAAMQAKRDEALRAFSAETSYAAAILDANKAIKENGEAWNLSTRKGVENRQALERLAGAWNEVNRSADQTPAAYRKARREFIETAIEAGATRAQARKLADQLLDIPKSVETKFRMETDQAFAELRGLRSALNSIDKQLFIDIGVRAPNLSGYGPQIESADGGTVPGARYPYRDKVHAYLAPGEEVVSNRRGQADKNRAALKAANAGATLAVVGYADGGTAGQRPTAAMPAITVATPAAMGPAIDYDRLTAAMLRARPLRGDTLVMPHNYSEFLRQQAEDSRSSQMDLVRRPQ